VTPVLNRLQETAMPPASPPQRIQHVFAATDLSEPSLHAVDRGLQIAQANGARCTVMHALGLDALGPLRNLLGDKADAATQQITERQRAALQAIVQDPTRHHGASPAVPTDVQIEPGLATSAVPASAARAQADLVVVGAKGDSMLRRHLLGSTASRLLRTNRGSVLVVKKACKGPYQRVLVPVDFSAASATAIGLVRQLAPQAFIVLLNVFDVPFEGMLQYAGVSKDEIHHYRAEARLQAMQGLNELARQAGLAPKDVSVVTEHGHAARHILETAAHARCDLIAMGKHGTHVTEELLLGSVTREVLSECHADLLVVVDPRHPQS